MTMEQDSWFDRFDALVAASRPGPPPLPPPEPESLAVPLPGGHAWRVRATLEPAQVLEWRTLLSTDGAPFSTTHRLWQMLDLGWTLPCPSPADMTDPGGWHQVPDAAQVAIFEWWCATIAPVLAGSEQQAAA